MIAPPTQQPDFSLNQWLFRQGYGGVFQTKHLIARQWHSDALAASSQAASPSDRPLSCARSLLSRSQAPITNSSTVLTIDFGATSTKVCVRKVDAEGQACWHQIVEQPHSEMGPSSDRSFVAYVRAIQRICSQSAVLKGNSVDGIAVSWSYPLEAELFTPANVVKGVTGKVSRLAELNMNEEPWNESLREGMDIGAVISEIFKNNGMPHRALVVGSDAVFTALAMPGAHAGLVNSNCTSGTLLVDGEFRRIGGSLLIPQAFLSAEDRKLGESVTLEQLTARSGLSGQVHRALVALAEQNSPHSAPLRELLKSQPNMGMPIFSVPQVVELANGATVQGFNAPSSLGAATLDILRRVAVTILQRSAVLNALMVRTSLAHQIESGETSLSVVLDSRIAREVPEYGGWIQAELDSLCGNKVRASVTLFLPELESGASVSAQGGARVIDSILLAG